MNEENNPEGAVSYPNDVKVFRLPSGMRSAIIWEEGGLCHEKWFSETDVISGGERMMPWEWELQENAKRIKELEARCCALEEALKNLKQFVEQDYWREKIDDALKIHGPAASEAK